MKTKKNIWKWLFFLLVILHIFVGFWVFHMVTQSGTEAMEDISKDEEFIDYFSIQMTREQLNRLLQEE